MVRPLNAEQRQKDCEKIAYLLWEADGKPENCANYYYLKAEKRIAGFRWWLYRFNKPFVWMGKKVVKPLDYFELTKEITIGNIITIGSVVISGIALVYSMSQSRVLEKREQANQIRTSAAQTVSELERWQEISFSLFDEIQPALVETSEMLKDTRSEQQVIEARDFLYKQLYASYNDLQKKLLREEIQTAYVFLYKYHPSIRAGFQDTLQVLETKEEIMFNELLNYTEREVMIYLDSKKASENYQTAYLGNTLRTSVAFVENEYRLTLEKAIKPMEIFLTDLILKSDDQLLKQENLVFPSK